MTRYVVAQVSEIPPGSRRIVYPTGGVGIGIFNVGGSFYALKNSCPHMGAPLCEGMLTGTTEPQVDADGSLGAVWGRDGEIIGCPWHHWEFDITTGRTLFPSRNRVASYPVTIEQVESYEVEVEDGLVVVDLSRKR